MPEKFHTVFGRVLKVMRKKPFRETGNDDPIDNDVIRVSHQSIREQSAQYTAWIQPKDHRSFRRWLNTKFERRLKNE